MTGGHGPGFGPPRDPGVQPERTLLAWSRTVLVLAADAALVIRTGLTRGQPAITVLGLLIAALAAALQLHAAARRRALAVRADSPPAAHSLLAVSAAVAACGATTIWCLLLQV